MIEQDEPIEVWQCPYCGRLESDTKLRYARLDYGCKCGAYWSASIPFEFNSEDDENVSKDDTP